MLSHTHSLRGCKVYSYFNATQHSDRSLPQCSIWTRDLTMIQEERVDGINIFILVFRSPLEMPYTYIYICICACVRACVSLPFKSSYKNIFILNYGDTSVLHLLKKENKIILIYINLLMVKYVFGRYKYTNFFVLVPLKFYSTFSPPKISHLHFWSLF